MVLSGCASTYHASRPDAHDRQDKYEAMPDPVGPLYVVNKDMALEYSIFKKSGRFEESLTVTGGTPIALNPLIKTGMRCGTRPMTMSCMCAGLWPVTLGNDAELSFTTCQTPVETFSYDLNAYERLSIWEWLFKPFNSEAGAYAKALKRATRTKPTPD